MKTAVVIIDVQNYFMNKHTSHLPPRIKLLLGQNSFDFILFTQFINHEGTNFARNMNWRRCFSSPDIDIVPELQPSAKIIFRKDTFSPFKSAEFTGFVTKNNISTLFLCGTDTDCCVYATAMDAFDLGLDVKVVADVCGSHHGLKFHQRGLKLIERNLGKQIILHFP